MYKEFNFSRGKFNIDHPFQGFQLVMRIAELQIIRQGQMTIYMIIVPVLLDSHIVYVDPVGVPVSAQDLNHPVYYTHICFIHQA